MTLSWPDSDLCAVLFLGVVTPLAGLVGLLTRATPRIRLYALAAAGATAVLASAAALTAAPPGAWAPPALLSLVYGLSLATRTEWAARAAAVLAALMRLPRLHAAALVAAGPALAAGWVYWAERGTDDWRPDPVLAFAHEPVKLRDDLAGGLTTDAGLPLPLFQSAEPPPPSGRLLEMDAAVISTRRQETSLIRTGPPTQDYNCHGWVFAGGRGWIQGRDVEKILADNHYYAVAEPRPGDLFVCRDPDGAISHSGVVRGASPGGPIIVESKWGKGGRFLHRPEDQPYGPPVFYRSQRPGHMLRGMGSQPRGAATVAQSS